MTSIQTNDQRVANARNLIDSLSDCQDNARSYLFIGKPTPWTDDKEPPVPTNSIKEFYDVYHEILSLRRIYDENAFHMIPRFRWISGTTYDMYRHDYSDKNLSYTGAKNLVDCVFYVINQNDDVYVCLDNNLNVASIIEPQNQSYEPFYTSDGYQWMRLFRVGNYAMLNYSTFDFIPITSDGANIDNYERTVGEILTAVIDARGENYTVNPGGVPNQITNYYCKIVGDGDGAVANVRVSAGRIVEIRIARGGSGYTYAKLDFVPNRVYRSLVDLDQEVNGLNPQGDGTFQSTVIISPPNGWGSDLPRQLGGFRVGLFSTLNYNLADFFPDTEFRQIGILQDPVPSNLLPPNPDTMSGVYAWTVSEIAGVDKFRIGEEIYQMIFDADKSVTHTARGIVVGWDELEQILRYIQIPAQHCDVDGKLYQFQAGDLIRGKTSQKLVEPFDYNGSLNGLTFRMGFADKEIQPYTGKLTYLSNITPIQRQPTQTERISLIISF